MSRSPLLPREPFHLKDKLTLSDAPIPSNAAASFFKSIDVSPDGTQILSTTSESNLISIHSISSELISSNQYYVSKSNNDVDNDINTDSRSINSQLPLTTLKPLSNLSIGESIYDTKWYPFMNASSDPNSCCFISSSRDQPIHLFDGNFGTLRCSYTAYDAFDELDTANCLTFNLQGDKIYAGFNRMIRSFDVNYPGKNYSDIPTCKSRKDFLGQKGLISALAFNPDQSKCYAAGSYANSVAIYVEGMQGAALEIRDVLVGGVTQVKWSNCGSKVWIGGRNNSYISCWDVRSSRCEIGRIERLLTTNQRMKFDIDPWGEYLITGTQDGKILVYSTESFELVKSFSVFDSDCTDNINLNASNDRDCVHSAVFHPYSSLVFTSTGQRQFNIDTDTSDNETEDDAMGEKSSMERSHVAASGIQVWTMPCTPLEMPTVEEEIIFSESSVMLVVEENSVQEAVAVDLITVPLIDDACSNE